MLQETQPTLQPSSARVLSSPQAPHQQRQLILPSVSIFELDWASLVAQIVKNLPAMQDPGLILGSGRCPGKGMATHSSILAWRIHGQEEPGGLQSKGSKNQTRLSD